MIRQIAFSDAEKLQKLNEEQFGYQISLSLTQTKLKQLVQEAKLRGYAAIRLNSAEHRKEAHKFYEHMGL